MYSNIHHTVTQVAKWDHGTMEPRDTFGEIPVGLITYTRYGYMSANMAATETEWRTLNTRWPPKANDSDNDFALVARHSMSYAGKFSINESLPFTQYQGQLLHGPMTVASMLYMVGATQRRNYLVREQDGETYLVVSVPIDNDSTARSEIVWRRVMKG